MFTLSMILAVATITSVPMTLSGCMERSRPLTAPQLTFNPESRVVSWYKITHADYDEITYQVRTHIGMLINGGIRDVGDVTSFNMSGSAFNSVNRVTVRAIVTDEYGNLVRYSTWSSIDIPS